MFIRRKRNKTGTTSVQVIDKSSGKYKVIYSAGSSADASTIARLTEQAKQHIHKIKRQGEFDFLMGDDLRYYQSVYENINQIQLLGPEIVLGRIFNEIGFDVVKSELFRHLVIARIIYPASKLKTLDYLQKYKGTVYEKMKYTATWISCITNK